MGLVRGSLYLLFDAASQSLAHDLTGRHRSTLSVGLKKVIALADPCSKDEF